MEAFKITTDNLKFKLTVFTWFNLFVLLIIYPGISLIGVGEDTSALLKDISQPFLLFMLITTVIVQWAIFSFNYLGIYLEGTGLAGIGLIRIKGIDFAWAFAFLVAANVILAGLAWFLAQVGLPMPGELAMLIPESAFGRVVWVIVSFTAGFCEEVAFRGYLMTRLRLLFRNRTWIPAMIISSIAFGICHAYQGIPGFILITAYGLMFSLLYIRTGRLWPCIIAHFFQDFGALFFPQ